MTQTCSNIVKTFRRVCYMFGFHKDRAINLFSCESMISGLCQQQKYGLCNQNNKGLVDDKCLECIV